MNDPIFASPIVIAALRQAWLDSAPYSSSDRHEEGGYIVRNPDQSLAVMRWPRGERGRITPAALDSANCYNGLVVIMVFHTHPNPPIDENGDAWEQEPSVSDKRWHARRNLPGYVVGRENLYAIDAHGVAKTAGKREQVIVSILQLNPILEALTAARRAAANAIHPDDEVTVDDRGDHWIFEFAPQGEVLGGGARVTISKNQFQVLKVLLSQ